MSRVQTRATSPRSRQSGAPSQLPALENLHERVGSLAEKSVEQNREHDNVGLHKLARLHGHVADAGLGRDRLREDQRQPHHAEREAKANEDRGKRTREDHAPKQRPAAKAVTARHFDKLRIDAADAMQRVQIDRKEYAERHDEKLRVLVDAEPDDDQRNKREMRH